MTLLAVVGPGWSPESAVGKRRALSRLTCRTRLGQREIDAGGSRDHAVAAIVCLSFVALRRILRRTADRRGRDERACASRDERYDDHA